MKKPFIWALALVTLCAVFTLTAPKSHAADIQADGSKDLREVLASANNGGTINLNGSYHVSDTGGDAPWVIDKSVTFEGGDVTLRAGGIILNADVTFRNTTLSFDGFVRNAIMANGHTLTLENVTCAENGRPLNLFCGGLYDSELGSTSCSAGTVIIKGKTSLEGSINLTTKEVGNIYAGNLCMGEMNGDASGLDGPDNTCQGDAKIIIDADSTSTLGGIYAGGAQQRTPPGQTSGKVILTDSDKYTVDGRVDITLNGATVKQVYGRGAEATYVTYTDTGSGSEAKILVEDVSSFAVESGYAVLEAGSTFCVGAALSSLPGAKLSLVNLADLTVGSFVGGGKLVLGEQQTLTVTGDVTGETLVAVDGFNFDETKSSGTPTNGYIYIKTPASQAGSFSLAPPSNQPGMVFFPDKNGNWFVEIRAVDDTVRVSSVRFDSETVFIGSGDSFLEGLPLWVSYVEEAAFQTLTAVPLQISINGIRALPATYEDSEGSTCENYSCSVNSRTLHLEVVSSDVADESLAITTTPYGNIWEDPDSLLDGTYVIELTIPGKHTESGQPLTASTTLKVGGDGVIGGISPGAGKPNTVRILLAAPGGSVTAGTVMAAVYDANGRLLSFGEVPFPKDFPEDKNVSVDVPVTLSGGKTIRVFAADDSKPLCQSQSVDLNTANPN